MIILETIGMILMISILLFIPSYYKNKQTKIKNIEETSIDDNIIKLIKEVTLLVEKKDSNNVLVEENKRLLILDLCVKISSITGSTLKSIEYLKINECVVLKHIENLIYEYEKRIE